LFFLWFLGILKGQRACPKKIQNLDFILASCNFEGAGLPRKIQNLDFSAVFLQLLRDGLTHKIHKTWTFPQFSWDFEGTDSPEKLANPQI
jgi:hypothetical protein